jgi:hypothetical protein
MLLQIVVMFALGLAAIGLGAPLMRLLAPGINAISLRAGMSGMIGLLVAASIAALVNVVALVGAWVGISLLLIGLVLVLVQLPRLGVRPVAMLAALALVAAPLFALQTEGYDGGLYHLPHQYWIVTEKLVFGLANLHNRFGFNSLNEYLLALGWLGGKDLSFAPQVAGLFSVMFLLAMAEAVARDCDDPATAFVVSMAVIGFGWIYWTVAIATGWSNSDVPTAICILLCVYCGFVAAARSDAEFLLLSYLFAGFATALKLSGAFVLLFPLALTVERIWRVGWRGLPVARLVGVASLFLPWWLSSIVITGCLAYPVSASCLPVPWESSREATITSMWVKAWARAPRTGLTHVAGWAWLPSWLGRHQAFLWTWAAIAVIGVAVSSVIAARADAQRLSSIPIAAFACYAVAAIAAWFLAAPEPRFGIGYIVSLAMLPGLAVLALCKPAADARGIRWVPMSSVGILVALGLAHAGWALARDGLPILAYRFQSIPVTESKMDGIVRRPVGGDRCFLTPQPCSPGGVTREDRLGWYRAYYPAR